MDTKFNQVKSAMHQLLTEAQVLDWEDAQIKEAMHKVDRWESRKLEVGKNFQDYKGMVSSWFKDQLSQPGSEYNNLETEVEDVNSNFSGAINTIKEQDRDRNLGTFETVPTSLMDYLRFGGLDS